MDSLHFDTKSTLPVHREAFWKATLTNILRMESEPTRLDDAPLEISLDQCDVGDLSILAIKGGCQQVVLSDLKHSNSIAVLLPKTAGGSIYSHGRAEELHPGRAYMVDFRNPVRVRVIDGFQHIVFLFRAGSSDLVRGFLDRSEQCSVSRESGAGAILAEMLLAVFANAPQITLTTAPLVVQATLQLLDAVLTEANQTDRTFVPALEAYHLKRVRRYGLSNLGDSELSVQSIALAVGLSTRRLHQLFADNDKTLMSWIWFERLTRCHDQLTNAKGRDRPISMVAYDWGFSDPAHFSRAFRQRYGLSPSEHKRYAARIANDLQTGQTQAITAPK